MFEEIAMSVMGKDTVLYDNNRYRDQARVKEVDRTYAIKVFLAVILGSLFVVLLDMTLSVASEPDLWWLQVVAEGSLIGLLVFLIVYSTYAHLINREMFLVVTEQGIIVGPKKKHFVSTGIERVSFRKGFIRITFKDNEKWPSICLLQSEYVWDIVKFKEALERILIVEDARRF